MNLFIITAGLAFARPDLFSVTEELCSRSDMLMVDSGTSYLVLGNYALGKAGKIIERGAEQWLRKYNRCMSTNSVWVIR